MHRSSWFPLAAVAAVLALPGPAGAAVQKVVSGVQTAGVPRVAGDQVVYEQVLDAKGKAVLRRAAPGVAPVDVANGTERVVCDDSDDNDQSCDTDALTFEASPTRVAFEQRTL